MTSVLLLLTMSVAPRLDHPDRYAVPTLVMDQARSGRGIMSDVSVGTRQAARLTTPISFTFLDSPALFIGTLEGHLAGIKSIAILFSAQPRLGRKGSGRYSYRTLVHGRIVTRTLS